MHQRHLKSPRKDAYKNFCVSFWRNFQAKKKNKRRNFRENFFIAKLKGNASSYIIGTFIIVPLPLQ